jgi:hypothetical protein
VWASSSPVQYYGPMIAAWVLTFAAVGAALLTGGRVQHRLIRIGSAALAVESVATVTFLTRPNLPLPRFVGPALSGIADQVSYAPGAYMVIAALIALGSVLFLLEKASRRTDPIDTTDAPAIAEQPDGDDDSQPTGDHSVYMRQPHPVSDTTRK